MKDLVPCHIQLANFRDDLNKNPEENKRFLNALKKNELFLTQTIQEIVKNKDRWKHLPSVVSQLTHTIGRLTNHPKKFESDNEFYEKQEKRLSAVELDYLKHFEVKTKQVLYELKNSQEAREFELYFDKFLKMTTFLCAVFDLKLVRSNDVTKAVVPLSENERIESKVYEYYIFYNRSNCEKNEVGIGKVSIQERDVTISYFYTMEDSTHKLLITKGVVENKYSQSRILVFKNITDDPSNIHEFAEKGPIETFIVLKAFGDKNEKFYLGTLNSWSRKNKIPNQYPFSTAVVVMDKAYYDSLYPSESNSSFSNMVNTYSIDKVPPEIYYYLIHQSINLEAAIAGNANTINGQQRPFTSYDQLPFKRPESDYFPRIARRYIGMTLVDDDGGYLLITQLEIKNNGMVIFEIGDDRLGSFKTYDKSVGFIKFLNSTRNDQGEIYLNLRFDYARQFNSFNIFLEFKTVDKKVGTGKAKRIVLQGCYGGESIFTHRPIAGTIVFEEIDQTAGKVDKRIEPLLDSDHRKSDELDRLYNENKSLFDSYLLVENEYSNYFSTNLLNKIFGKATTPKEFIPDLYTHDVFISIPLSYSNNNEEYERNCKIADGLRRNLMESFGFTRGVYCACFAEDGFHSLTTYKNVIKKLSDENGEDTIIQNLEKSKYVFFVFPKRYSGDSAGNQISLSILEIGYSLGLKKKVVLLYDEEENHQFPENLLTLTQNNRLLFKSNIDNPIDKFFERPGIRKKLAELLELE